MQLARIRSFAWREPSRLSMLRLITISLISFWIHPLTAVEIEGRLPGSQFREDNPPRYGAVMSFVSRADSVVLLHAVVNTPSLSIANQLKKIAKGFKIKPSAVVKIQLIDGTHRWLQYSFRKQNGGGFIYITRIDDDIVYLVVFNLLFDALANDLPYLDRYIQQLSLKSSSDPKS
jgi:hypothetical protein